MSIEATNLVAHGLLQGCTATEVAALRIGVVASTAVTAVAVYPLTQVSAFLRGSAKSMAGLSDMIRSPVSP